MFILCSAVAGAGWLYSPDVFLMLAAQSHSSDLLDTFSRFLSALGALELTLMLLLALVVGLYKAGRRRLARWLFPTFLATGLLEDLLKQFLPVPPIPSGFEG